MGLKFVNMLTENIYSIVLYSFLGGKKHKQKSNLVQMGKLRLLSTWVARCWWYELSLCTQCDLFPWVYSMTYLSLCLQYDL